MTSEWISVEERIVPTYQRQRGGFMTATMPLPEPPEPSK